jgi:muramoyltetrapeptide carboxypeptidase
MIKIPPYLKKGDTIGLLCPAGYMPQEKVVACIDALKSWGYEVKIGSTIGNQFHYFSGTDEERLHDLQSMLDDENIHAILCARGGYGTSRIIDAIDFTKFIHHPKWVIGFSDVTVLHAHINRQLKIATLHAPMAAAFLDGENEFTSTLRKALSGEKYDYQIAAHSFNKNGETAGELIGGNLAIVAHLIGSHSSYNTKGKILFLEDVGEYLYNIDRMLLQLKRSGMLKDLAGLIIGGFTEMKDTTTPFGKNIYEIIQVQVKEYNYPVCYDFPVSHGNENVALKVGVIYKLRVESEEVRLVEITQT